MRVLRFRPIAMLLIVLAWGSQLTAWADESPREARRQGSPRASRASRGADRHTEPSSYPMPPLPASPVRRASFQPADSADDQELSQEPEEMLPPKKSEPALVPDSDEMLDPALMSSEYDESGYMDEAPAPVESSGSWYNGCRWYVQEDVTYLDHSERKRTNLATDLSPSLNPRNPNRLRTQLNLEFAPGARITLGRFLGSDLKNRDGAVEFTFLGLNNWTSQRGLTSTSPNFLVTDLDPSRSIGGFNAANFQQYTYKSQLYSGEVNFRLAQRMGRDRLVLERSGDWVRTMTPHATPSLFAGFRVVSLNETFFWLSEGTDPTTRLGTYNVHTHNTLAGFHVGGDYFYKQAKWRSGVRLKGGPFVNFANQSSQIHVIDNLFSGNFDTNTSAARTTLAFVGELNITSAYQFRPNMALRASYEFLFISALALADKQLNFVQVNPAYLSTAHIMYMQGVSFGFEMYW